MIELMLFSILLANLSDSYEYDPRPMREIRPPRKAELFPPQRQPKGVRK